MKAYVGIYHTGVCALVVGNSIIEADIEIIKNIEIAIAADLFLAISIFLFSPLFCELSSERFLFINFCKLRLLLKIN
jgi:hypothetical protein